MFGRPYSGPPSVPASRVIPQSPVATSNLPVVVTPNTTFTTNRSPLVVPPNSGTTPPSISQPVRIDHLTSFTTTSPRKSSGPPISGLPKSQAAAKSFRMTAASPAHSSDLSNGSSTTGSEGDIPNAIHSTPPPTRQSARRSSSTTPATLTDQSLPPPFKLPSDSWILELTNPTMVKQLLKGAIEIQSQPAYATGIRYYQTYLRSHHQEELELHPTRALILDFIAYAFQDRKSANTIAKYCSAISHFITLHLGDPTALHEAIIARAKRGAAKNQPRAVPKTEQIAITPSVAATLLQQLPNLTNTSKLEQYSLAAAITLGVFNLLHGVDIVEGRKRLVHFTTKDVYEAEGTPHLVGWFPQMKNDYGHHGQAVLFVRHQPEVGNLTDFTCMCPVRWLTAVLPLRPRQGPADCVFQNTEGKPSTTTWLARRLKELATLAGLDATRVGLRSLRRGGATALAKGPNAVAVLRKSGRWTGSSWIYYLAATREELEAASAKMVASLADPAPPSYFVDLPPEGADSGSSSEDGL